MSAFEIYSHPLAFVGAHPRGKRRIAMGILVKGYYSIVDVEKSQKIVEVNNQIDYTKGSQINAMPGEAL